MNIYDEALAKLNFELRGGLYEYYEDEDLNIPIKALERAKKVEELLKWYQEKDRYFLNRSYYFDKRIEKLENELEKISNGK